MEVSTWSSLIIPTLLADGDLSLNSLMEHYCPYAVGFNNNGWIVPSRAVLQSAPAKAYIKALEIGDAKSLIYWLEVMNKIRNHGIYLRNMEGIIMFQVLGKNLGFNCNMHLLPILYTQQGYSSDRVRAEWVPYTEFMSNYDIADIGELFHRIIEIILFGFPLLPVVYTNLRISDLGMYAASRMFQGYGDQWVALITGNINAYSAFLSEEQLTKVFDDETNIKAELEGMTYSLPKRQKVEMSSRLQNLRTRVTNGYFIGDNHESLITLLEAKLFTFGNKEYETYLKSPSLGYKKVGLGLWKYYIYGENMVTSEQDSIEFWGDHSAENTDNYTGQELNLLR